MGENSKGEEGGAKGGRRRQKERGEEGEGEEGQKKEGEGRRTDCALFVPVSLRNQLSNCGSLYQLLQGLLRTVTIAMELSFDGKEISRQRGECM